MVGDRSQKNQWLKVEHKEIFWVDQKIPYFIGGVYYTIIKIIQN